MKDEKITKGCECFLCGKQTADLHYKHFWLGNKGTVTLCVCDECVDIMVTKALGEKFWEEVKDSPRIQKLLEESKVSEETPEEEGDA